MSKVEFIYGKGGKKVMMARRYAETLRLLGHGTYATTAITSSEVKDAPKIAEPLIKFAKENAVDLSKIVGTGKDGAIKKADIEAVIAAQDLA